ncbi:MAG: response regulator [Povalibacter sp.]
MTSKRALIVDDSRSARVILSRMLEAYDLQVDAAESAEQALEYLRHTRPDVIFMDHLMPGMDGFQAIQAIKGNPDTATIPVMMYTSQEGELYVSQARALGAVGVLPKTVKPGDVSRVLYQLHLLPERREGRSPLFNESEAANERPVVRPPPAAMRTGSHSAVHVERAPPAQVGEMETAIRNAMAPALREYNSELRRYIASSIEVLTRKVAAETKNAAAATEQAELPPPPADVPPPRRASLWPAFAAIALVALVPAVVLGVLYARMQGSIQSLMQSNAHLASVVEEQQAQLTVIQQASRAALSNPAPVSAPIATSGNVELEPVPYGEAPMAGARLEHLRTLIEELRSGGFKGKVRASSFVGEFCLTGNGIEGYSIASDDLPVKRCDLIGNPFDDSLTSAQRQSLPFANLVSSIPKETSNALSIEVAHGGRVPAIAYPEGEALSKATAGDWNRIAAQNNRVEFMAVAE